MSVGPWGVWRIVRDARLSSQATRQPPLHVSEKIGSCFQRSDLGSGTEFKVQLACVSSCRITSTSRFPSTSGKARDPSTPTELSAPLVRTSVDTCPRRKMESDLGFEVGSAMRVCKRTPSY